MSGYDQLADGDANVSISTVSRVLNRRNLVNSETRKRVESAISQIFTTTINVINGGAFLIADPAVAFSAMRPAFSAFV